MNDRTVGEVFNVGSDVETSILQLAEMMIRIAGSRSKVVFVPQQSVYGESYEDVPRRVPCVRRMHEILGVRGDPTGEGPPPDHRVVSGGERAIIHDCGMRSASGNPPLTS